jgi:hypothetical protein
MMKRMFGVKDASTISDPTMTKTRGFVWVQRKRRRLQTSVFRFESRKTFKADELRQTSDLR